MLNMIVLATTNKNKIREFETILKDFPVDIRSLADFRSIPQAVEDGVTFEENAYKKAHHVAKILGLPAIADDSGLVVEALSGAPGIYSARYAGVSTTDDENITKLLTEMQNCGNRKAYFQCVISIAVPAGPALTYEGRCDGQILGERRGEGGFGYDPVFYMEELGKTFAEVPMEKKNTFSHRGKALKQIQAEIDKIIHWLNLRLEEEKPEKPDHDQYLSNDWSNE